MFLISLLTHMKKNIKNSTQSKLKHTQNLENWRKKTELPKINKDG